MIAPRRLQLRRGNTAAVSSYLGAPGELIVNTDTNTLYIHDGATVGGIATTVNVATITNQITAANVGMRGYVDFSISSNIANIAAGYTNTNVKSYLGSFDGNIIPSANVAYSLGNITHQWRDLFVSNTTIYIGGVPVSISDSGNLTVNGTTIPTTAYVNQQVANVTVDLTSYALNANVTAANVGMLGYVNQANTIQLAQITSANVGMKGYVDSQEFYSNAKVATYLPAYSGNTAISNITRGAYTWGFGTNGTTTLPGNLYIEQDYPSVLITQTTGDIIFSASDDTGTFEIRTNAEAHSWTFGSDGKLTFPNGSLTIEHGMGELIQATENLFVVSPALTLTAAPDGANLSQINMDGYGNVNIRSIANNGADNRWTFGADTSLTFPDNTVQTTAYSNTAVSTYLSSATHQTFGDSVTITGNLTIQGNLFLNGNTSIVNTNNLIINDNIIYLANANPSNSLDIGFAGHFVEGIYQHTGFVRQASTGTWKLFSNVTPEPGTTVDFTNAVYDNIQVGNITSPTIDSINANALAQQTLISSLQSNSSSQQSEIYSLQSNATAQQTTLNTLLANAATQSDLINAINANVASANIGIIGYINQGNTIQSTAITQANLGMKGYVDNAVSTIVIPVTYSNVNVAAYLITNNYLTSATANLANYAWASNVTGGGSYSNIQLESYLGVVAKNINPATRLTYTLGEHNKEWSSAHIQDVYIKSTLQAGDGGIGYSGGNSGDVLKSTGSGIAWQELKTINGNSLFGNGDISISGGGSNYGNGNVASYLPTYSGNIANIRLGVSGVLTFADSTAQTTAWTGTVSGGSVSGNVAEASLAYAVNISPVLLNQEYPMAILPSGTGAYGVKSSDGTIAFTFNPSRNRMVVGNIQIGASGNIQFADGTVMTTAAVGGGSSNYSNVNVAAYLNASGYNLYSNVNVAVYLAGNITTGNITTIGNVTASNFVGNVVAASVSNPVTNSNTTITAGSYTTTFDTLGNVTVQGNVTANYLFGNGFFLTGVVTSGGGSSSYGNANVAQYLQVGNIANISVAGNVTATYFVGNGALLTGIATSGGSYSNVQVATYLPTYTGNIGANITVGGTLRVGSTLDNAFTQDNALYVAGGITTIGNIASGGRLVACSFAKSTSISTGAIQTNGGIGAWGNIYAGENIVAAGNAIIGASGYTVLPTILAQFTANANTYAQLNIQNISALTDATSEYVATANNGTDTTFFVDIGIANSNYDVNSPNNSLGTTIFPNDSYLYAQGNLATTTGGNLAIGTSTPNKSVKIFAGGINSANIVATVSNTGLAVTGNVTASAGVSAVTVTASGNITAGSYIVTTGGYGNISQVDTITANNVVATANVTVSGIGVVMPNRPAFRVNGTSLYAGAQSTANVNLKGVAVSTQYNQGNYFDATTGKFTAPVAGIYEVLLNARINSSYNGLAQLVVLKNGLNTAGNVIAFWETTSNAAGATHFGVSGTVVLATGDYLSANILSGNVTFDNNDNWSVTYLG